MWFQTIMVPYHTSSYCFHTGCQICKLIDRFIRAFAKFWKVTVSLVIYVCTHETTWSPLEGFSYSLYWGLLWKLTVFKSGQNYPEHYMKTLVRLPYFLSELYRKPKYTFGVRYIVFEPRVFYEIFRSTKNTTGTDKSWLSEIVRNKEDSFCKLRNKDKNK